MAFRLQIDYRLAFSLITARLQGSFAVIEKHYALRNTPGGFADRGTENCSCAAPDVITIQLSMNLGYFLRLMNKMDYIIIQ